MHLLTEFYDFWLKRQSQMLKGASAAILVRAELGPEPVVLARWSATENNTADAYQALFNAATQALAKQRLHLVQHGSNNILLAQPLRLADKLWGVVVFLLHGVNKKSLPTPLKAIAAGQQWLQFSLAIQQGESAALASLPAEPQVADYLHSPALTLVAALIQERSLQESCIALVNLLATHFGASRVSLALRRGKKLTLTAVSFSANFDARTQAMQLLQEAMYEALEQHSNITFNGAQETSPNQSESVAGSTLIQAAHQQLFTAQQLACIDTQLLRAHDNILGVLLVETEHAITNAESRHKTLGAIVSLAAQVLALKQEAQHNWRQGVSLSVKRLAERWFGQSHPLGKIFSIGLLLALMALFVPVDYHVSASADLQSAYKYLVVSPQQGFLASINHRPGDKVNKGELLGKLKNKDLQLKQRKFISEVQQYQQKYDMALAKSQRVDAAIARAQKSQAQAQLQLIKQQLTRTQLRAPASGVIVSDDISQSLGAPVKQGEVLFVVAANKGYKLYLYVDERNVSAIKPGQSARLKLTSLPQKSFNLTIKSVSPLSEVRDGRNYFRVNASLHHSPALLRPGMTGNAKIMLGKRPLGWVLFHPIINWLRLHLWF